MNEPVRFRPTWKADQVEAWIESDVIVALATVQLDYPDAFLGGGYLRDRHFGFEPKDIDIFTFRPMLFGRTDVAAAGEGEETSAGKDSRVKAVERFGPQPDSSFERFTVEVVHLDPSYAFDVKIGSDGEPIGEPFASVEMAVGQFGFGLQQIWYDQSQNKIRWTPLFERDVCSGCMTVSRTEHQYEALQLYSKWQKLQAKFPGWRLVVPTKHAVLWEGMQIEELHKPLITLEGINT